MRLCELIAVPPAASSAESRAWTGGNGIERNDREPGQKAFDKRLSSAALRRVGGAMNPVEQFRSAVRRNRKVLFGVFR